MFRLKYDPNKNKISFDQKKSVNKPSKSKKSTGKRPNKNTLEQRIRKLENENKDLWEALNKLKKEMGL